MKLAFIELCGFRGFRDLVRLEFPAGFAVITGRNGVGKSTLCDAVEFALTGEIDKYRVEKAAKESFNDYLWWRGKDAPRAHYVKIGFETDDGRIIPITRSREAAPSVSAAELERMLCVPETKPDQALRQLCRTSIIRDEWIAALSLDLSDTERFDLVRAALGTVEGADYAARAKQVVVAAEATQTRTEREYEEARGRLNSALAELAAARTSVLQAGDLSPRRSLPSPSRFPTCRATRPRRSPGHARCSLIGALHSPS